MSGSSWRNQAWFAVSRARENEVGRINHSNILGKDSPSYSVRLDVVRPKLFICKARGARCFVSIEKGEELRGATSIVI